jgi:hypothetical protein
VNPSFSAAQLRALEQLVALWKDGPRFVLIGAAAINCHRPSPRGTYDLDIVIAIPLEELPAGLDRAPAHSTSEPGSSTRRALRGVSMAMRLELASRSWH